MPYAVLSQVIITIADCFGHEQDVKYNHWNGAEKQLVLLRRKSYDIAKEKNAKLTGGLFVAREEYI